MKPFFSLLVTAYNEEKWIGECIESVKGQSFEDFECLIRDDASTDGTLKAAEEAIGSDKRFKLSVNAQNVGGGVNIFRLLCEAGGEICVEVGGDDFLAGNGVLARIKREYDEHPGIDATHGSFVMVPGGGIVAQKPANPWYATWSFVKPLTFRRVLAREAMNEYWDDIIDPKTGQAPRYGWDVALFYPVMVKARNYRTIWDIIYAYRLHPANDQNKHREEQIITETRMSEAVKRVMAPKLEWWKHAPA